MAVASPTDHPTSVRNRYVIDDLVAFLCCHLTYLNLLFGIGFYYRTESDIFLLLLKMSYQMIQRSNMGFDLLLEIIKLQFHISMLSLLITGLLRVVGKFEQ